MKIIVITSLALLVVLLFPYVYKVGSITCVSQYGECSPGINSDLDNLENNSIKSTELNINTYASNNSKIQDFKVRYKPLGEYSIEIIEDKSVIAVKEHESEQFILLSEEGEKITETADTALPKLFISRPEIAFDAPEVKFASVLLVNLYEYYGINMAQLDESSIVTEYKDGLKLIFPVQGDVDILLGSLELLLFQLNAKLPDTKITSIDLRYKNPVVK